MTTGFAPTERTRLRRRPQRGAHDAETVFGILDASVIAHVGYVLDGAPFVTPTVFWREGRRLLWHGSASSRALRAQLACPSLCVTVSHLDGLVLGRSGFAHSAVYRSVMAFGRAVALDGSEAKRRAMDAFLERLYPGRTAEVRPVRDDELELVTVVSMEIEEASAKRREDRVNEKPEDLASPGWAGLVELRTTIGARRADPRVEGQPEPPSLAAYREGAALGDVLAGRG